MSSENQELDCAICLQKCHHPAKLPCGHIFCFLCVKGITIKGRKCAMCRTQIPANYLDNPVLLETTHSQENVINSEEAYQWYYEGRNGWWKYDERSNSELEATYNSGEATECLLLLAGAVYSVDFQNMVQVRRSDRTRRRKVRRDVPTLPAKGIAGIKQFDERNEENTEVSNDVNSNNVEVNDEFEDNVIEFGPEDNEVDDTNTNHVNSNPDIDDLTHSFSYINIQEEATRDEPT